MKPLSIFESYNSVAHRDSGFHVCCRPTIGPPHDYALRGRDVAEPVFRRCRPDLRALGCNPEAARNAYPCDPACSLLGVYFSAFAGNYALRNLYPQMHVVGSSCRPFLAVCCHCRGPVLFGAYPKKLALRPRASWRCRDDGRNHSCLLHCLVAAVFVSYCRSLIAVSSKQVLSPEVKDVTGIQRTASGDDFKRVMQLLQLCPERPEDKNSVQAIGAYFNLLSFLRSTLARIVPSMRAWRNRNAATAPTLPQLPWSGASLSAGTCWRSKWTPEFRSPVSRC